MRYVHFSYAVQYDGEKIRSLKLKTTTLGKSFAKSQLNVKILAFPDRTFCELWLKLLSSSSTSLRAVFNGRDGVWHPSCYVCLIFN